MGIHNGLPLLAATFWLLLVSSGSALSTSQQLRGASSRAGGEEQLRAAEAEKSENDSENNDDDDDDDDDDEKESAEEKAADKARDDLKKKLEKKAKHATAKLMKNGEEQEEINMQIRDFKNGDMHVISANAKAVISETESATMGNYLGDMWKEMRTFSSPFYQEHIMERREQLERKVPVLQKRYKAELLKLERQKLEWAKQDAKDDANDETDAKKKEEDLEKAHKLAKEEKRVAKEEKRVESGEEDFNIFAKPPWMQDKKEKSEAAEEKEEKPAEDNQMKPDWMQALEAQGISTETAPKLKKEEEVGEEDEDKDKVEKKKTKKKAKSSTDEDGEDDEEEKVEKKKSTKKKADDEDGDKEGDEGFDITGKPPWMKNKKKEETAPVKKAKKPAEDNTVKPDWMKALEDGSDDEDEEEEAPKTPTKKKAKDSADEDASAKKDETEEVPVAPRGKHEAMFTEKTMPGVSPTVQCVTLLAWQFFIVYTAMAVLRTVNQISQNRFASCMRAQELVGMVMPFVMFAPMLSVLFLATRMRAIQLAQGDTEKYELPQPWVQFAMYTATYGVMLQVVFKLLTFMMSYRVLPDGSAVPAHSESKLATILCTVLNFAFMGCIYVGFSAVCLGAIIMPAPEELWGNDPPKVSAALSCTMILTTTFFAIYLGLCLFRSVEELRPRLLDDFNTLVKVQLLFWRARHAVNLAPMLCVLFIVARMRALQMDPKHGNPPTYAQVGMYCAAGAMVFQVVMSIALPLIDRNAYILPGPVQGQIILVMSIHPLRIVGDLMRYIPLLMIYGGASAVVAGVFLAKAPDGQATPGISATMRCVISLTTMYFAVFTAVYVAQSVMDRLPDGRAAKTVLTVLDAGQRTVMLAPMLCILFIAARMRALQLTRTVDGNIPSGAGPQKWVQDGMYFATGAMFLQVLMGYLGTLFLGPGFVSEEGAQKEDPHEPKSTTQDANELRAPSSGDTDKRLISPGWAAGAAVNVVSFICLIGLYGGVVAVMVGTVTMTPETLPPYHSSPSVVEGAMKLL